MILKFEQPSLYGKNVYGKNSYPTSVGETVSTESLYEKIVFFNYRIVSNSSFYFEGLGVTSDYSRFNKIELKWNFVRNAIGYCIYKGDNEKEMSPVAYTKENFHFLYEQNQNKTVFFKILPLFKKEVKGGA